MNALPSARLQPRRILLALPLIGVLLYTLGQSKRQTFDIKEVGINEAKALIAAGALILDVREKEQFDHRHIPGAVLIPLAVLKVAIPAAIAYTKDRVILVYCGDGVTHGPEGTEILNKAGFTQAVNLKPGIEGWAAANLPLQRG